MVLVEEAQRLPERPRVLQVDLVLPCPISPCFVNGQFWLAVEAIYCIESQDGGILVLHAWKRSSTNMGRPLWEAALGSSRVPTWQSFSDERKVESRNEKSLESTRPLPDIGPSSSRCSAKSNNDVVSWSGEDDLENPQKFRLVVKCLIGIVIGLMNFVVSLAISLFTGILDVSGREFHQSIDRMQLALTLYILGLAFGG